VARALGIDTLFCTQLAVREGRLTGGLQGPLCFGEGKAIAAQRLARAQGLDLAKAYFYSDSDDDLPLLRRVGRPVAVNPSARLARIAGLRGWPLLQFDSRGVPSIESLVRTLLTVNTVASTAIYSAMQQRLRGSTTERAPSRALATLIGDVTAAVAGLEFDVSGGEHLASEQPAVYVFNHQSFLDTVVLARLLRHDAVALCKRELAANPVLGPLMAAMGVIYVDRDAGDQRETIERARAVLSSGRSLVIAPEGTRSANGRVGAFKTGAFFLAKKARVPIVPIVLHNVHAALPKGGWLIRPARIRVTVLPPIAPEAIGGLRESCAKLRETYRTVLADGHCVAA
jgi:putative phosphoserine phosphatase / 1-acylglycerol-3-phosphate O-acyltransferase